MKLRRVEVEWLDSTSWSSWRPLDELVAKANVDELRHRSCGYLIADNEDGLMVALNLTDPGPGEDERDLMVADVVMIPRAVVGKVKELR